MFMVLGIKKGDSHVIQVKRNHGRQTVEPCTVQMQIVQNQHGILMQMWYDAVIRPVCKYQTFFFAVRIILYSAGMWIRATR